MEEEEEEEKVGWEDMYFKSNSSVACTEFLSITFVGAIAPRAGFEGQQRSW